MKTRQAFWVGSFVLAALVLAVATILAVSGGKLFANPREAIVYFDGSVKGLYVGAPVSFRGVKIGEVTRIGVEVDNETLQARIPVRLVLNTAQALHMGHVDDENDVDIPDLVRLGLRAQLSLQSVVTGQMGVDLNFHPDAPPVPAAPATGRRTAVIPTTQGQLDALISQVQNLPIGDLMARLMRTIDTLEATLQTTQKALQSTDKQVALTAAQARESLAAVATVLNDVKGQTQATLASVQQLADTSRETIAQAQPELHTTLARTRDAADAAQRAMQQLSDLSAPGAPLRADLESAVSDLSLTARSLRSFADQVERQPNILLFGGPQP